MEEFNKIMRDKNAFGTILIKLEQEIRKCQQDASKTELKNRPEAFKACLWNTNLQLDVKNLRNKYSIPDDKKNWEALGLFDSKRESLDEVILNTKYPLSPDEKWMKEFNSYKHMNYLSAYFKANDNILYSHETPIISRNLCMNKDTFNGNFLLADELVNCIKKSKEILKDNKID